MMTNFIKHNLLFIVSCLDIFAVSLIIPLFNQYLENLGFSNLNIGFVSSMYSAIQFLASPIIGHLCDVYSSKRILSTTLLCCALAYPLMGIVSSFVMIIITRSIIGFVKHTQLLCKNYIRETSNGNKHLEIFGKLNGFTSLGYIAGPVIGGYIINLNNGFMYMCFITGFLFALNALAAHFLSMPALSHSRKKVKKNMDFSTSFRNIPWLICWDIFVLKLLAVFAVFSFFMNYYSSISKRFQISALIMGYSMSLQAFVRAITGFMIKRLLALFPSTWSIMSRLQAIYFTLMLTFFVLYLSHNFYVFLAFLVPLNVCVCFIRIMNHEELVTRTDKYNIGIILGAFDNVTAVCRFVLPVLLGYVVDKFGYDSVYIVIVFSLIIGIVIINCRKLYYREKIE